jgi:glutamine synthetase
MLIVEYIWLDADDNFRSKIRTMSKLEHLDWNFDGSSTNQATTESSEVILKVVAQFKHPFISNGIGYIFLCATYDINNKPLHNNYYHFANEIFNKNNQELEPWFGLEQEYFIYDKNLTINNIQMENNSNNNSLVIINSNKFYCSPINQDQDEVKISMEHLEACIKAGILISGSNAEVVQHQWEFQIGPVEGINAGHQLMVARYLLNRIAAKYNKIVNYHPKPINNVNGSGCHINFSTNKMREENGLEYIMAAVSKLCDNHSYHMENYGKDNNKRMTGIHETSNYDKFTWGIGSRNTSVRIGNDTFKNKKGYFEDRRPASNIDPYLATSIIFQTCCL